MVLISVKAFQLGPPGTKPASVTVMGVCFKKKGPEGETEEQRKECTMLL